MVIALIVLAGVTRYVSSVSRIVAFVFATLALAGVAWVVSMSIEQVGHRLGPAITGVMQATLANLPEFFVVIFALGAGETGDRPDRDPRLDPRQRAARPRPRDRRRREPGEPTA